MIIRKALCGNSRLFGKFDAASLRILLDFIALLHRALVLVDIDVVLRKGYMELDKHCIFLIDNNLTVRARCRSFVSTCHCNG